MARKPAVAGMFYEGGRAELIRDIESCFLGKLGPGRLPAVNPERAGRVVGLVCPHAGYVYSGSAAAHAFDALACDGLPETAVLLGPNHHGLGGAVAVSAEAEWETPLGTAQVDLETASEITRLANHATRDDLAHAREHSLEVQVPFLQYLGGDKVKIVPITIAHLRESDALALALDLGSAIAKALEGKSAVVIASTDFTHYESQADAKAKDARSIERILDLDAEGLLRVVYGESMTMCGVIGTAVMVEACKAMGAKSARKLTYYTSGDVTGETRQVVGYGAVSVER